MQIGSIGGIAASAMNAFSVDMMARANNIANVNTPGFHAQDVRLTSGPQNQGVAIGQIAADISPGPPMPGLVTINANGAEVVAPGYLEGSNTDIVREFTHMMSTQRAYEANAVTIRTVDDMIGMLLDMKA